MGKRWRDLEGMSKRNGAVVGEGKGGGREERVGALAVRVEKGWVTGRGRGEGHRGSEI